jgi:hypothetical protein
MPFMSLGLEPCLQSFTKMAMESYTPADMVAALKSNLARPLLQRQQQDARNTTMNKVKQLYLEHRYKQCAALCEETLKEDTSEVVFTHKMCAS